MVRQEPAGPTTQTNAKKTFKWKYLTWEALEASWASNVDVPYWRLYVSKGSSGQVRDLRSKAKSRHKHTLGGRRGPEVCLCPGFALDRRSRTSPDDPYDTYKRH